LTDHRRADDDKPTEMSVPTAGTPEPISEQETTAGGDPKRVGRYFILDKLGEGGMGTVYAAEQREPVRREVALKLIKLGMDTREVVRRFEAERQALAVMDHPNIAKVLDAGATLAGRPFFVMELVHGTPIDRYCDQQEMTTRQRLELFVTVCQAVQHAHQKGVIHRDLKPTNILVSTVGGQPLPKVIDFGVAKATGQGMTRATMFTETGQLVGTPEYMSPEQAEMSGLDVDTRTDVYALGVILYELLTGDLPFDSEKLRRSPFVEMQRIIRELDPPTPSTRLTSLGGARLGTIAERRRTEPGTLSRQLRGDLDWIVMKALEKDRSRRYETANALALDVRRHLDDEPVLARPPSRAYRMRKFVRRNRLAVAAAAALSLALVAGVVGTTIGLLRAQREAAKAHAAVKFIRETFASVDPEEGQGRQVTVREVLDQAAADVGEAYAEQPEIEALIRSTIGGMYQKLGFYAEAEPQLERALALQERLAGDRDLDTMKTLSQLGQVYLRQRRHAEAERIFERLLAASRRTHGKRHDETLTAMHNLAAVYLRQQRYAEAEPLLEELLAARRELLGEEDRRTTATMNNLAHLYKDTARYAEAETLFRRALDVRRRTLGDAHPRTLISAFNLGELYRETDRVEEAEPLIREALAGFREKFGDGHPYTLEALNGLAALEKRRGRLDEAEGLASESYRLHVARLGADDPATREVALALADICAAAGRPADADAWRRRAEPRADLANPG